MTPERYNRMAGLFLEARRREGAARSSYLGEACGDDPSLVGAVERLLARDTGLGDGSGDESRVGMGSSGARLAVLGLMDAVPAVPERLGTFAIFGVLGQGAMGVVYRALQQRPAREVALKVIRPGWATPGLIRRFELEAAALARLRHPGIAQIYEAGTFQVPGLGVQPYFAMELVEGPALTEYARQNGLTIAARVELMIKVCQAVQHAHQRGIIHRDLKPGNILVEAGGQPRILDFGVARLTDADMQAGGAGGAQTQSGAIVGTLGYMSPEQAAGDAHEVDTRSDVYALGVIAYLLFSGRPPLDLSELPLVDAVREIREREPARLGTVDPSLRGDLETIVAKALEKDRARRYSSAGELGADFQRLLRHEPVTARPATALYQIGKLARRHRLVVAGAGATLAALVLGSVGTTWQMVRAMRAERRGAAAVVAEGRRADELKRVAEFQAALLGNIDAQQMGMRLRGDMIADVGAALERSGLSADEVAGKRAELESLLARGNPVNVALKTLETGIFDRALEAANEQFRDEPLVRVRLLDSLAGTLRELGLFDRAWVPQNEALTIRRRELGDEHPDTLASMSELGVLLSLQKRLSEAEGYIQTALEGQRRLLGEDHPATLRSIGNRGALLAEQDRLSEAESWLREALERMRRVLGDDDRDTLRAINNLGGVLNRQGRYSESESCVRAALETQRRLLGDDHRDTLASVTSLGNVLFWQGKLSDAEPYCREAVERRRRILGDDHPDTLNAMDILGHLLGMQGRFSESEPCCRAALEGRRRVFGDDSRDTLRSLVHLSYAVQSQGKLSDAEPLCREAAEKSRRQLGDDHPETLTAINNLGTLLQGLGRYSEAEPLFREALEKNRRVNGDDHPQTLSALSNLGNLLLWRERVPEAEPVYRELVARSQTRFGKDDPRTGNARVGLGRALSLLDRYGEAETELVEAERVLSTAQSTRPQDYGQCVKFLVMLYDSWEKSGPEEGRGAKGAPWRVKLGALRGAGAPAGAPATDSAGARER